MLQTVINRFFSFLMILSLCVIAAPLSAAPEEQAQSQPASASDVELVKEISKKLSVTPEQAAGGAGAIFNYAKGKLSQEDFGKISGAVPGMDQLLKAVPVDDNPASAMMAKATSNAAGIAALGGSFNKLGLSPDMVGKFVPEVLNYVQAKGGEATMGILKNVLK